LSLRWPKRRVRGLFAFQPRWKEELAVTGPGGGFILAFWMGIPTVSLPPEERWAEVAPAWAADLWRELHDQLSAWCQAEGVRFEIDSRASIW
jgi:hypothetical protein